MPPPGQQSLAEAARLGIVIEKKKKSPAPRNVMPPKPEPFNIGNIRPAGMK
jgi:hypothetical protein